MEITNIDYIVVPKNSGLKKCKDIALDLMSDESKIQEVRGEDVPLFTERLISQGKNAVGITGEDLFKEFLLNVRKSKLGILKRVIWDGSCLYGKPTLCLMGSKNKSFEELPKNIRVCINSKYKEISKKYCTNILENKGYKIEKIYASRATEDFFSRGLVDMVIDIVCSGKSADSAGLKVYDKLFESDIVIIGQDKKVRFTLNDLYDKIKSRIVDDAPGSYTKKLINDELLLKRKLVEESAEVITAKNRDELIWECSDLIYFLFVIMAKEDISIQDLEKENERRNESKD